LQASNDTRKGVPTKLKLSNGGEIVKSPVAESRMIKGSDEEL